MKKALKLLLVYFILMLITIGVGSVLYSIYLSILASVNGDNFVLFSLDIYLKALFFIIPCACIVISPILAFAHIRNRGGVFQLVMYILLSAVTWGVILPVSLNFGERFDSNHITAVKGLSKEVFREADNKIYYFTNDLTNYRSTSAVIIDKSHSGTISIEPMMDYSAEVLYGEAAPFTDSLIKNSFNENYARNFFDFGILIQEAKVALDSGWNYWLAYLAFGFALCSLYGISGLFVWKLLDVMLVLFMTLIIFFINSYSQINPFIFSIVEKINGTRMFSFLGKYMNEPFFVLLNLIFGLIFIVIGIVKYARNKKKQMR